MRPATMPRATRDTRPLASQSKRHPPPHATRLETITAESAMPAPTPAKWTAESPDRPAAPRRSRTRAEAKTSTNALATPPAKRNARKATSRSEEHTSELQSRLHLVCRLLLEKKKKKK